MNLRRRRSSKKGMPQGSLVYVGGAEEATVKLTLRRIDGEGCHGEDLTELPPSFTPSSTPGTLWWLDVHGLHDTALIGRIGDRFGLHPLLLEDILNTTKRPKYEEFPGQALWIVKMLYMNGGGYQAEQLGLVVGLNWVITFQEPGKDTFDAVRRALDERRGKFIAPSAQFLACALIDSVVDGYFAVLEDFGEQVELLEREVLTSPQQGAVNRIYELKRTALLLRRSVWPLREALGGTIRRGSDHSMKSEVLPYFHDIYDHAIEVIDLIEGHREVTTSLLEVYLSSVNTRLNRTMKTLTLLTAIFMPLSLIAGIYGMNFTHMPEITWKYGYPFALGLMALTAFLMLTFFRRLGVLETQQERD